MKRKISKEERMYFKNNSNLIVLSNNIELESINDTTYSITLNKDVLYDKIYLLGNIPIGSIDIDIEYQSNNRCININSNNNFYKVELNNNEYFILYEDEANNYLYIDIRKHSLDITSRDLDDVLYPILKTEIVQDYDNNTIGKIYLKLDEEQLDDFCVFITKNKDFNHVVNEIQYLKDKFNFYSSYLEKIIRADEKSTLVINNNIYKIISINQIYIELLALGVKDKKISKYTYLDIINSSSNVSFIEKDVLISYEGEFYKNNIKVDNELHNKLSPKYSNSELEKMKCLYNLVMDSKTLDTNINAIINDMINNYYILKDKFFNELNDWEKECFKEGIYFVLRNDCIMFDNDVFEYIDKDLKREIVRREEH